MESVLLMEGNLGQLYHQCNHRLWAWINSVLNEISLKYNICQAPFAGRGATHMWHALKFFIWSSSSCSCTCKLERYYMGPLFRQAGNSELRGSDEWEFCGTQNAGGNPRASFWLFGQLTTKSLGTLFHSTHNYVYSRENWLWFMHVLLPHESLAPPTNPTHSSAQHCLINFISFCPGSQKRTTHMARIVCFNCCSTSQA